MSGSAALFLLRLFGSKDGRNTLRTVMIVLAAVFVVIITLVSALLNVLLSPFEYNGALGEFKHKYAYLVAEQQNTFGDPLSDAEIDAMVAAADTDEPERQNVLRTALSLVGRVPYFWGGKSPAGWNEEWNTLKLVTAPGVSSSGTLRPYGLDCSGFSDWVWRTAGYQSIGSGVHAQFWRCELVDMDDLQPGDLVFKNWPDNNIINHVGIYYGKDENGKNLYIHCSAGAGGVVVNSYSGFAYAGVPQFESLEKESDI